MATHRLRWQSQMAQTMQLNLKTKHTPKCAALTNFHWITEKCCFNISANAWKTSIQTSNEYIFFEAIECFWKEKTNYSLGYIRKCVLLSQEKFNRTKFIGCTFCADSCSICWFWCNKTRESRVRVTYRFYKLLTCNVNTAREAQWWKRESVCNMFHFEGCLLSQETEWNQCLRISYTRWSAGENPFSSFSRRNIHQTIVYFYCYGFIILAWLVINQLLEIRNDNNFDVKRCSLY